MKTIIKKLALGLLLLPMAAIAACPNFVPGQLSASALNNAFAAPCITAGTINGAVISDTPISGASGSFSTLAASSTVSGVGFSTYLASPPAIGGTAPAAGAFTTLSASSTLTASSGVNVAGTLAAASNVTVAGTLAVTGTTSVGAPTSATHSVQLQQVSLYPTVASATTIDIFGAAGATINVSGTTTVTGLTAATAAQVGSIKTIIPSNAAGFSITASSNLVVDGATSGTYLMPLNANIQIIATSTTTFKVTTISATGTWTPNQGGGLTVVGAFSSLGYWSKVGNQITLHFFFSGATSVAVLGAGVMTTNVPFTVNANISGHGSCTDAANAVSGGNKVQQNTTTIYSAGAISASSQINCSSVYIL